MSYVGQTSDEGKLPDHIEGSFPDTIDITVDLIEERE